MSRQSLDINQYPTSFPYLKIKSTTVETNNTHFRFNLTVYDDFPDPVELFRDDDGDGFLRYTWDIDAPPPQTSFDGMNLEYGDYRITVWADIYTQGFFGVVDFVVNDLYSEYEERGVVDISIQGKTMSVVVKNDRLDNIQGFTFGISTDTWQDGHYYGGMQMPSTISVELGKTVDEGEDTEIDLIIKEILRNDKYVLVLFSILCIILIVVLLRPKRPPPSSPDQPVAG